MNKNKRRTMYKSVTEAIWKCLDLIFSSSFSFFSLISLKCYQSKKLNPLPLPPHAVEGRRLISSSPRRAVCSTSSNLARLGELVTSLLSFLVAQVGQGQAWAS